MSNTKKVVTKIDYIIDATNVCNWHIANQTRKSDKNEFNANVSLDTLLKMVVTLLDHRKTFQCIFDANTAYNLPEEERSIYNHLLNDYKDYFYQVTGGIRADSFVLSIASNYDSRVISNDNFSDYQSSYPWIKREHRPQRLFKGGIPLIVGIKHLVIPDLKINTPINQPSSELFHELKKKLGFGDQRHTGLIKDFEAQKGVGFIETETGELVYFKRSSVKLNVGDEVDFLIKLNNDKTYAADIAISKLFSSQPTEEKNIRLWEGDEINSGTVEWFNDSNGFGVISEEGKEQTVFFFRTGYLEEGLPRQGQEVVFERKVNKKGPYAVNIKAGNPKDFILKKELLSDSDDLGSSKEFGKLKKEFDFVQKRLELILPVAQFHENEYIKGYIKEYQNGKGAVGIDDNPDVSYSFTKSGIAHKQEKSISKGVNVLFKVGIGKRSIKAHQIKKDDQERPARVVKADNNKKEAVPAPSKNNNNNSKSNNNNNQPAKNEQKAANNKKQHNEKQKSNNPNTKKTTPETTAKNNNKNQSKSKTNNPDKPTSTQKETPKTAKGKKQNNNSKKPMKPTADRGFNSQKMVYWARDKKGDDFVIILRLIDKENKMERWIIREDQIKDENLRRLFDSRLKFTEEDIPNKAKSRLLSFSNKNLTPSSFTTNQKSFLSKSWKNWEGQVAKRANFEEMKAEIISLHEKVKSATFFDGSIESEIVRLRDKVLDYQQADKTSKQQSAKLRNALSKCFEALKNKRRKNKIR